MERVKKKRLVAHLRMIKDKIRKDDQVEGCMRVSRVCGTDTSIRRQRSKERLDGLSPHVPKHARGAAAPRLDVLRVRVQVLRGVERQIVDERLVRVIREDDLHTIRYISRRTLSAGASGSHIQSSGSSKRLRTRTHAPFARRTLRRRDPAGRRPRPTRAPSALRKARGYAGENRPARAPHSIYHRKKKVFVFCA